MIIKTIAARLLVIGALSVLGFAGLSVWQTRCAIDSARRENAERKARQERLRDEAFELGVRAVDAALLGHRIAAQSAGANRKAQPRMNSTPSRDASNEAIMLWLAGERARLQTVEQELSAAGERTGSREPAPVTGPEASEDDRSTVARALAASQ